MKLTSHLYLSPKLRMSGAMPLLPLYSLMACTDKILFLSFTHCGRALMDPTAGQYLLVTKKNACPQLTNATRPRYVSDWCGHIMPRNAKEKLYIMWWFVARKAYVVVSICGWDKEKEFCTGRIHLNNFCNDINIQITKVT
jgi:hypothetical protein